MRDDRVAGPHVREDRPFAVPHPAIASNHAGTHSRPKPLMLAAVEARKRATLKAISSRSGPAVVKLAHPGARADAETAQVHRVHDVLAADDGVDRHRHEQRRQLANLSHNAALHPFHLVAACPLRIQRDAEVAPQRGHEAEGQVHRVSEFIRQP
jgi:hypothetical protein